MLLPVRVSLAWKCNQGKVKIILDFQLHFTAL